MANSTVLLSLLILCAALYVTECGRFSSRGGSRSSSSSWGKGWGGSSGSSYKPSYSSSSGSSYKPSSSSGSSWFGSSSGSSYKPSSSWSTGSSSGSSYKPSYSWNTGSSSSGSGYGSGSHSYPSSSSGLSGSSSGSHSYPWSSSGLSGSSSGSHSYPSSSSGLSGSSSGSHRYPSSSSGLSGSSSGSHSYPSSSTGLSGNKPSSSSGSSWWSSSSSSGSGSHSYPSSGSGLSGSNSGRHHNSYKPTNTYQTNSGYGSGYHSSYIPPVTYYHYPQHVYVTEYRDSGSRYGDLLTGLTWYNLGRSQSHYHDHYYYDDYYHRYHNSPSSSGYISNDRKPEEKATCTLRVTENGKLEVLKIPCSIVSTFTEESQKVNNPRESYVNSTVCTTETTVIKRMPPDSKTNAPTASSTPVTNLTANSGNNSSLSNSTTLLNVTATSNTTSQNVTVATNNTNIVNAIPSNLTDATLARNITLQNVNQTLPSITTNTSAIVIEKPIIERNNFTNGNTTTYVVRTVTPTEEVTNVTVCKTMTDPLKAKGPPIDLAYMDCEVDIKTNEAYLRHKVDCSTLMKYSKRPPPKKASSILPEREKLKQWIEKPPWWASLFIAV